MAQRRNEKRSLSVTASFKVIDAKTIQKIFQIASLRTLTTNILFNDGGCCSGYSAVVTFGLSTISSPFKKLNMSNKSLTRSTLSPSFFDDFFKPWNEWFDDSRLLNRVMTMPAVNIIENGNQYNVSLAAPGLKKEDFKIDVDGHLLTISSEKEENTEEKGEKFNRKEYSYSSFSRSFSLPEDVKPDAIDARYENGVLNIRLPRKEEAKAITATKRIAVK